MVFTTACRKYVEIAPVQQRVLEYTADYEALLNNSTYMDRTYTYPLYAEDDAGADTATWQNGLNGNTNGFAYTWAEKLIALSTADDNDWYNMYFSIYQTNLIIVNVMNSKGGTDAQKRKVLAAAQVHRAFYYHTLVNMYAKQYDSATANTDLGLPLRLDDLITGSLKRVSVQAVYNQILADLNSAVATAELPNLPDFTNNASKTAAYAMLARTYLDMRNFPKAEEAANNALQLQSTVNNLNNYVTSLLTYPQKHVDPELIFSKAATNVNNFPLSPAQLALFADTSDLRFRLFTAKGSDVSVTYLTRIYARTRRISGQSFISGPTVPEMMLIKAECEARAGSAGNAVAQLNALRKSRFTPAQYQDLTAATPAEALQLVIRERKIELMCTGRRWFDQRRLAKDGLTPTITRLFRGTTYTLEPGSNRYVFPIADKYILQNPEIEQNPR
ncbi:hypothetical protein FLA_3641 [Filimonas lacunae]|nr:hypothetical protein FLA_3641 [Filimonas lacunae]